MATNAEHIVADLDSTLEEHASAPAEISADGVTVKEHPLPDLVKADRHLRGRRAGANVGNVLSSMRAKLKPPGAP